MEKGHAFILSYIKNIEDQLLWDNFAIGEELTRHKNTIESLIDWMFNAKKIHKISAMAYSGYEILESALPDHEPVNEKEES